MISMDYLCKGTFIKGIIYLPVQKLTNSQLCNCNCNKGEVYSLEVFPNFKTNFGHSNDYLFYLLKVCLLVNCKFATYFEERIRQINAKLYQMFERDDHCKKVSKVIEDFLF